MLKKLTKGDIQSGYLRTSPNCFIIRSILEYAFPQGCPFPLSSLISKNQSKKEYSNLVANTKCLCKFVTVNLQDLITENSAFISGG